MPLCFCQESSKRWLCTSCVRGGELDAVKGKTSPLPLKRDTGEMAFTQGGGLGRVAVSPGRTKAVETAKKRISKILRGRLKADSWAQRRNAQHRMLSRLQVSKEGNLYHPSQRQKGAGCPEDTLNLGENEEI